MFQARGSKRPVSPVPLAATGEGGARPPSKSLERMSPRARAWLCAGLNQLAFPGLGTILAGRRIGYLQAGLMLGGFILATGFMLWYIFCALSYAANAHWTEATFRSQYEPFKWTFYVGLILCGLAWAGAMISSLSLLRAARTAAEPKTGGAP